MASNAEWRRPERGGTRRPLPSPGFRTVPRLSLRQWRFPKVKDSPAGSRACQLHAGLGPRGTDYAPEGRRVVRSGNGTIKW